MMWRPGSGWLLSLALAWAARADVSVLTWNVAGNAFADPSRWNTNAPEVQAAGRIVAYLDPDIITFQEIPLHQSQELTNFVKAFLPSHRAVFNSGTDGFLRSAVLSRFPINRSVSHLDGVSLSAFGSSDHYTRDLFEAEIVVPGWPWPLNVFTTHLKAGRTAADMATRAAEASAVSNYVVKEMVAAFPDRPFVLTGDLNEDVTAGGTSNPLPRLVNAATTLQLLTPVNPATGKEETWNIRSSLVSRYDYVLPSAKLATNVVRGQVFRSDTVTGLPAPLKRADSATATDHLPVLVTFADPFPRTFRMTFSEVVDDSLNLRWETFPGFTYHLERSTDLRSWSEVVSAGTNGFTTLPVSGAGAHFRIRRVP
jgi:endonuclease/exonuclease/phosphatase family metal-dependent hydrolase